MSRIVFITGTGTGVGKTVLTALLLSHLRQEEGGAVAMKPFCSGSREDARVLYRLQKEDLTLDETNPFFFRRPLAPWVDARERGVAQVPMAEVLRRIRGVKAKVKMVLVEGSGGILVPLGDGYGLGDLMVRLGGECIVAAPNCLGTINHTLLTVQHLQIIGMKRVVVVMMGQKKPDLSSKSNVEAIRALLPEARVELVPYLGESAAKVTNLKHNAKYLKKTLARVLEGAILITVPSNRKGGNATVNRCGPSKQVCQTLI